MSASCRPTLHEPAPCWLSTSTLSENTFQSTRQNSKQASGTKPPRNWSLKYLLTKPRRCQTNKKFQLKATESSADGQILYKSKQMCAVCCTDLPSQVDSTYVCTSERAGRITFFSALMWAVTNFQHPGTNPHLSTLHSICIHTSNMQLQYSSGATVQVISHQLMYLSSAMRSRTICPEPKIFLGQRLLKESESSMTLKANIPLPSSDLVNQNEIAKKETYRQVSLSKWVTQWKEAVEN